MSSPASLSSLFSLEGQVALVTGCRRGIGLEMALALAEAGADIIGTSQSLETEGSEVETRVRKLGRSFRGYSVNFGVREEVIRFADQLEADGQAIDILINNAGTIRRAPAAQHPLADWDDVLEINLSSAFLLSQRVVAGMFKRGHGKIIFTASLLSFQGGINVPGYAASKGAVASLTKALANEWAARGVNVNAIVPGYIATDNTQALREDAKRSEQILARIPAGRWGEASDFRGAAVFLASKASDYVHGSLLVVDGGWLGR